MSYLDGSHEAHGLCRSCQYPAHLYPFGWQHVGSGMYACDQLRPAATCCDAHADEFRPSCPDGGTCHHRCRAGCFRVQTCGPLSGVFPGDVWPEAVA